MTRCGEETETDGPEAEVIETLFVRAAEAGSVRLHPIEVEILGALRGRPVGTWCWAQLRLLEGIVLKAEGRDWRQTRGRMITGARTLDSLADRE